MHSLLPIMKNLWKDISKGIEVWADPGGMFRRQPRVNGREYMLVYGSI